MTPADTPDIARLMELLEIAPRAGAAKLDGAWRLKLEWADAEGRRTRRWQRLSHPPHPRK